MNDLIDRAEAQTELQLVARRYTVAHEAHGEGKVVWSDNLISVTDVMNALREIPPAQPEQRWIPCSGTVDIPDHEVMACDRYGEFIIGYVDCKDKQWICESDSSLMYDPVAWCELPKPYKEGGTDVQQTQGNRTRKT